MSQNFNGFDGNAGTLPSKNDDGSLNDGTFNFSTNTIFCTLLTIL